MLLGNDNLEPACSLLPVDSRNKSTCINVYHGVVIRKRDKLNLNLNLESESTIVLGNIIASGRKKQVGQVGLGSKIND